MVGKTVIVQTIPMPYTEFTTAEFPERAFEASGHQNWKPGQKVAVKLYRRHGEIVSYDFIGER